MKAKEEEWFATGHMLYKKKKMPRIQIFSFHLQSYREVSIVSRKSSATLCFPHLEGSCLFKPRPGSQKLLWIWQPQPARSLALSPSYCDSKQADPYYDCPLSMSTRVTHEHCKASMFLMTALITSPCSSSTLQPHPDLLSRLRGFLFPWMVPRSPKRPNHKSKSHSTLLPLSKSINPASTSNFLWN